ncbi:MAG: hypothetical protein PHH24_00585 [Candidatus Moranbacteria bacterium]|jgi:hypothetical protein|nr:hypothetical protein [Candidatus Moranbacteria bacterium]MDD5652208.1 hypothetical protein [Candidatus Moranbacteria bacterium]MDX9855757.1 hypothetical protein [Candidatus Moranbacteria bacterium]
MLGKIIKKESVYYWSRVAVIGVLVGASVQFVFAWAEPELDPPGGNLEAPINVSDTGQTKYGTLDINTNNGSYSVYTRESLLVGNQIVSGSHITAGGNVWTGSGYIFSGRGEVLRSNDTWLRLNQANDHTSGTFTPYLMRADGGYQVDGKWAISADNNWHRAQYSDNTRYGYFEGRRQDGTRGFYLGWGNGGTVVNLGLDNANYLDITGNQYIRWNSPQGSNLFYFNNATATKSTGLYYDGSNQFSIARFANNFGAWEKTPYLFQMNDNGNLVINNNHGLRITKYPGCGKLYTDSSGVVQCGQDQTGSGRGLNLTNCYGKNVPDNVMVTCGSGEVMTGALSYGQNQMQIMCCRATVQ